MKNWTSEIKGGSNTWAVVGNKILGRNLGHSFPLYRPPTRPITCMYNPHYSHGISCYPKFPLVSL